MVKFRYVNLIYWGGKMKYEYNIDKSFRTDIEELLKNSKVVRKICRNNSINIMSVAVVIANLILFVHNNYKLDISNLIILIIYILFIVTISVKVRVNINISRLYNYYEEIILRKQCIEVKEKDYFYTSGVLNFQLKKQFIQEVICSEKYTLILLKPRLLKSIWLVFCIMPNDLFGDKEKYNEFISSIKGE